MMRWGAATAAVMVLAAGAVASAGEPHVAAHRPALPTGFSRTVHLAPGQLHDRAAMLRWLAPHATASGRLLTPADGAPGAAGSSGDASQKASAMPRAAAGTTPDITGDGINDVFQLNFAPRRYLVRDGRTGRVLWQRDASAMFDAEYALLGSPARQAMLVQTFTGTTGADQAGVAALDLRTGRTLWSTSSPAASADGGVAYAEAGAVYLAGVSSRPHQADQVLVGVATDVPAGAAAVAPQVLDGATGTAGSLGAPMVSDDVPWLTALPDVTGDGIPDYMLTANGLLRQESARDGATGLQLWSHQGAGTQFGSFVELLPHAAAGQLGVLVEDGGFDDGAITAYGAATGTQLWTAAATVAQRVEDADRDHVPDVILIAFTDNGFAFTGISGRTGARRWTSSITIPDDGGSGSLSIGGGTAGDLTGDGVTDLLFTVDLTGRTSVHEQRVIDGRTGRSRSYTHLAGYPLRARLSSRGDALIDVAPRGPLATVTARDLSRTLWKATIRRPGVSGVLFVDYGKLTRRNRTDVLVSLYGGAGSDIVALDGATGHTLWAVHV